MKKAFIKKAFITGVFLAFSSSLFAQGGVYFDIGLGLGKSWTKLNDTDIVETFENSDLDFLEVVGMNLGLKLGYGPFGKVPLYLVADFGGIAQRLEISGVGSMQFNTYIIGGGLIFYPVSFIQIAGDFGYSYVANQFEITGLSGYYPASSEKGWAWDVSFAFDLGKRNHGLLIGVTYFSAKNNLTTGATEDASFAGVFVKYAYRHKNRKPAPQKADVQAEE